MKGILQWLDGVDRAISVEKSPTGLKTHQWKETTAEGVRIYTATVHGGRWKLRSRLKTEEEWTYHDPMELPELRLLREMLWKKYQRQRIPFKHVEQIDKMIEKLEEELPPEPDPEAELDAPEALDAETDANAEVDDAVDAEPEEKS